MTLVQPRLRAARTASASASAVPDQTAPSSAAAAAPASRPPRSQRSRHLPSSLTAPTASSSAKAVPPVRSSSRLRQGSGSVSTTATTASTSAPASQPEHGPVPGAPVRRPPSSRIRTQRQLSGATAGRPASPTTTTARSARPISAASNTVVQPRAGVRATSRSVRTASTTASRVAAAANSNNTQPTPSASANTPAPTKARNRVPKKATSAVSAIRSGVDALATPPSSVNSVPDLPPALNGCDRMRENMFTSTRDINTSDSDDQNTSDHTFSPVPPSLPRARNPARRKILAPDVAGAGPIEGKILTFGTTPILPPPAASSSAIGSDPVEPRPARDRETREQLQKQRQQQLLAFQQQQHERERQREQTRLRLEQEAREKEERAHRNMIIDNDGDFRVPELWVTNPEYADVEIGGVSPPDGLRSGGLRNSLGDDEEMIHAVQCQREFYLETIDDYWQYPAFEKADDMRDALNESMQAKVKSLAEDDWVFEGG